MDKIFPEKLLQELCRGTNCRVVGVVVEKDCFSEYLCAYCICGCSYVHEHMCTHTPYSKSHETLEFGLCYVELIFTEIIAKKLAFLSSGLRIFCFTWRSVLQRGL
jgi:hypothetical protein